MNKGLHSSDLKTLREVLCGAQFDLNRDGGNYKSALLGELIAEIDRLRPLGPNGKHGKLHTYYCQCDLTGNERIARYLASAPEGEEQ